MILNIGHFGVVPDLTLTLDKNRYYEENKKEIYLELDLLEQYILLKGIYAHFKKLNKEDFNRIIKAYKNEQPEYMLECVEEMIKNLEV